jgi:hypothetical protein
LSLACYSGEVADILSIADLTSRRRRRLRFIGVAVLVLGIGGAGLLYRIETRSADVMNDPSMAGFYKAQTRQMGELYGQMGLVTEGVFEDLKHPDTQAKIIVAVSILVAAGCFYLASLLDGGDEPVDD